MDSAVGVDSETDDPAVEEERYPGPPYDEWEQFALDKEYSEYINFLRNVAVVPEEEGVNGGAAPQGH